MQKLIKDDMVAVIYSPGYGAGWSTWGLSEDAVFDPQLARLVEKRNGLGIGDDAEWNAVTADIVAYVEKLWPKDYFFGVNDLEVAWLPVGTKFRIDENDGYESILVEDDLTWTA